MPGLSAVDPGQAAVAEIVESFKKSMRQWVSGVTVVTTRDRAGRPHGFTASSFTSVSLAPPTVLVCLDAGAECHPAFSDAPWLAVNVLRRDQEDLAGRFARKGAEKFAGLTTAPGLGAAPLLERAVAVLECAVVQRLRSGTHLVLLAEVRRATSADGEPLAYYQCGYCDVRRQAAGEGDRR
jgi:flavin reductase ActVB